MKIPATRRPSGFTLVELLVVIAIIAVLASAGFAAGNAAIQRARKVTTAATAVSIETAVNNFFTEYGSMPTASSDNKDQEINSKDENGLKVLRELMGSGTELTINTRSVKFLSLKEGKSKKNGVIYEGNNMTGVFDSWGGPFHMVLDTNYDDQVTAKPSGKERKLNGRKVAVWSNGLDAAPGGTGGLAADDVKTWE